MASAKTPALRFGAHHGTWRPFRGDLPGQSRRLDLESMTSGMGAGFTRIDRTCDLAIQPEGDQVLHVISGEIRVTQPELATLVAHAGDVLLLRKGAKLSLSIIGHCHFFYVLSPDADWRETLASAT